jgi:hypothetical protein
MHLAAMPRSRQGEEHRRPGKKIGHPRPATTTPPRTVNGRTPNIAPGMPKVILDKSMSPDGFIVEPNGEK